MTRQEQIIAVVRTAVPAFVGYIITLLIAAIPVVGEWIAWIDAQIAAALPTADVTMLGLLQAAAVALVVGAYYWAARLLGQRWPIVERFLLGSAKQPVGYVDATKLQQGHDGTWRRPVEDPDDGGQMTLTAVVGVGVVVALLVLFAACTIVLQHVLLMVG
jgi:hypothetical protein